jgi:mRNA interferase MazF
VGAPAAGTVVLIPFPFSDLSRSKLRPAVVLAAGDRDDLILCQVTSNPYSDKSAIAVGAADFRSGSLQRTSYARPSKLFTANAALVLSEVGLLHDSARQRIIDAVVAILRGHAVASS